MLHPQRDVAGVVDEEGKSYHHVHVVDGQQRLTTIVIFLDAIATAMKALPNRALLAEGTRKSYVAVRDLHGMPAHKLRLGDDLQGWFTRSVLTEKPSPEAPKTSSEQRLLDAKNYFARYLDAQSKQQGAKFDSWLLNLRDRITRRLKLSLYEVGDAAEVGVIFEVMNNRGKPLTELEKVKNYVLYLSTRLTVPADALRDATNKGWAAVFQNLASAKLSGSDHEDRLLRAHWLMAYDHNTREWDGSRSIKKRFNLKTYENLPKTLRDDLLKYVDTLRDTSSAYRDVFAPHHHDAFRVFGDEKLIAQIKAVSGKLLRLWVTAPFLPALLAVRLRAPHDGAGYLELVRLCELFAFRVYRWGQWRTHTAQSTLVRLANEYYREKRDLTSLLSEMRACLLRYHPEATFEAELKEQERDADNDWYGWDGVRYFLYEYEEHRAGGEAVRIAWKKVSEGEPAKTIEHVLPQTPTDPYWKKSLTAAQMRRYTHDIGNLCLTSHNGELSNKAFDRKKGSAGDKEPCYANSILVSERDLALYADWNIAALQARREKLVAWARERWRVSGAIAAVAPTDPEVGEVEPDDE